MDLRGQNPTQATLQNLFDLDNVHQTPVHVPQLATLNHTASFLRKFFSRSVWSLQSASIEKGEDPAISVHSEAKCSSWDGSLGIKGTNHKRS